MPTITKEKEQRKREAMAYKGRAYRNLSTLMSGGAMSLEESLRWWEAIATCRSMEDAEGIWRLLQTWIDKGRR